MVWGTPQAVQLSGKVQIPCGPLRGLLKGSNSSSNYDDYGIPSKCTVVLDDKRDVILVSVYAPIHSNSSYRQTIRWSIYETRGTKHPHSPILRYEQRPPGTRSPASLHTQIMSVSDENNLVTLGLAYYLPDSGNSIRK